MSDINITTQNSSGDLSERPTHPRHSRSNRYDVRWIVENQMGSHARPRSGPSGPVVACCQAGCRGPFPAAVRRAT
ncbi:hypothetical protein ACWD5R_22765 [Streptomyces sp. NPDC002514]|uniref:hypothetical protein n=1 Tax=Streptomyces sp. NPDC001270 TaxID=3364554 RepID=UPI00368ECB98